MTRWQVSDRADPIGVALADRHYNRQHVGSPQFVPPGRNLCFVTDDALAVWTTSWPYAEGNYPFKGETARAGDAV